MNTEEKSTTFCESSLQRKRRVQFADREEVHDVVRRRSQISRQSMQGIWFVEEDFSDFVEDMEKCVDKMEHGKQLKDKKYSSLGLESLTEEGSAIRQAQKENAWDAVLWEQEYQREEGKRSSIQIAEAYAQISRESQLYAHEQAQHVHDEVDNYLLSWDDAYLPRDSNHSKELVPEEHHKAERRRSRSVPRRTRVSVC